MNNRIKWITEYNKKNNDEYKNYVFTGKYLAILKPNHPKARTDGYVYIHQLQAEKKLGRYLDSEECVHHIDEDKYNNDIENLMIFKTKADHTAFHMGSTPVLDGDVYICTPISIPPQLCPICNSLFTPTHKQQKYCSSKCRCMGSRRTEHPSKEELLNLILNNSFVEIAKMYGVSDNTIRKWCKNYQLPYIKNDINKFRITYSSIV